MSLLAIAAVLGLCWQAFAGHFEHLGMIPHAHAVAPDQGKKTNPEHNGLVHHHHLPDLDMNVDTAVDIMSRGSVVQAPVQGCFVPEPPVFGIDHPPQLS